MKKLLTSLFSATIFQQGRPFKFLILALDLLLIAASFAVIFHFRMEASPWPIFQASGFYLIVFLMLISVYLMGGYDLSAELSPAKIFLRVFLAMLLALSLVVVVNYFSGKNRTGIFGRGVLIASFAVYCVLASFLRRRSVRILEKLQTGTEWLFLISDKASTDLREDLKKNGFRAGFTIHSLSDTSAGSASSVDPKNKKWHAVVIGDIDGQISRTKWFEDIVQARFKGMRVFDLVGFYETSWQKVPLFFLKPSWFLESQGFSLFQSPLSFKIKRLFDLLTALILLFLVWPLILLALAVVRIESRGPGIYKQVRVGKDGKAFTIYKLRTMGINAETGGAQWAQKNDDRITFVGSFLRKTRIDELPQLVNVIKGDMSFIGPRPERPEFVGELEKQIPYYQLRHTVQPGLTGLAQILYPYGANVQDAIEKLQYELFYIKNHSLLMDLTILLRTVSVVVFGRGR